jgi:hypothetical protein
MTNKLVSEIAALSPERLNVCFADRGTRPFTPPYPQNRRGAWRNPTVFR